MPGTEPNGDLVFLIGKTDAYTENGQLVKLGRVRVSLTPSPFTAPAAFRQVLHVGLGEMDIRGETPGAAPTLLRVWVDANHPVVHVEGVCGQPVSVRASVELWRLQPRLVHQGGAELDGQGTLRELNNSPVPITIDPDTVLPARSNRLAWCHFNSRSTYPLVLENQHLQSLAAKYPDPLLHRTFGVVMQGVGMVPDGEPSPEIGPPADEFSPGPPCPDPVGGQPGAVAGRHGQTHHHDGRRPAGNRAQSTSPVVERLLEPKLDRGQRHARRPTKSVRAMRCSAG